MDSIYRSIGQTTSQKAFRASYLSDVNAFVTQYLKEAQDESRKLVQDTPVGAMYIRQLTTYVLGNGLQARPSPMKGLLGWDDERYSRFVKEAGAYFRLMTDRGLDWYGRSSFEELQQIAFQNILISGDVLVHRCYARRDQHYRPLLQLISGTWVQSPGYSDTKECIGGVRLDGKGRETGYYIMQTDDYLMDTFAFKEVSRYTRTGFEEFRLVKLFTQEANQIRGVPWLSRIRNQIIDLNNFTKAHIAKAIASSLLTVVIQKDKDAVEGTSMSEKMRDAATIAAKDDGDAGVPEEDQSFELGTGNVIEMNPGETAKTIESQLNGGGFSEFVTTNLDIMGGAVGVATEMATGKYNASYSASRGTIGAAEKWYSVIRRIFGSQICTPEYEQIIDHGIRTGVIDCPEYLEGDEMTRKAILSVVWMGPNPVMINPTAEVNAVKTAIELGIKSHTQGALEMSGSNWDEVNEQLKMEYRDKAGPESSASGGGSDITPDRRDEDEEKDDETGK